jgi:Transglutaminase-like superfamily/TgpA N-terminal domain
VSAPTAGAFAPGTVTGDATVARMVAGSIYVAVVVILAALAAWPIYRSASVVILVVVAALVSGGIASLAWRRSWGAGPIALALGGAVFVLGVPLAVPSRMAGLVHGDPLELLRGFGDLASGLVLGWKDLVTVDLPVGSYRNLLVPALVIFLVGTCVALLLAWREDRVAFAAVPVGLGMISFGLFFGRTTVSNPLRWGPITIYAPLETALGIAALLASLLWLAWRSRDERMRSLQRAAVSSGVRVFRRSSPAARRRAALGAGMIVVAVVASVAIVPFAARGAQRDVLRTAIGPELDVSAAVSPLAEYRGSFADAEAEDVLFRVESDGPLPERVRIATLDSYDGEIYRSGGATSAEAARFVRVPSRLDAGDGRPVAVTVTIDALQGIWMPTVGQLESVDFEGGRAASLADGFYYRSAATAGVQTAGGGLLPGDSYLLNAVEPAAPDLTSISAPGGTDAVIEAPASLRTWVDQHRSGADGAELAGLVDLLRDRGYLSHALSIGAEPAEWMSGLPGYGFQPSAAGHSLARIDAMFTRLLERESDPQATASGNFVAAVGDDEQFAVAVALIAQELGFPARVVVGAVLKSADAGTRRCEAGVCRAPDLSAWTEVRSADGRWVPIDVTPQFDQSPSLEVAEQSDPLNVTEVRPDTVEEVVPPDPLQEDTARDDRPDDQAGLDLGWLWPTLRIAGLVLLVFAVVLGPFAVVVAAKAFRRRARRLQEDPVARIAGGWEEYVDAAVDARRDPAGSLTRSELAALYLTPAGDELAEAADRATFSNEPVTSKDAESYWRTVDAERSSVVAGLGIWRRFAATVSLRSFVRHLAPSRAGSRLVERGKRRVVRPAR